MYINSKLAKSVRLALMFGAASTAFAGTAAAQQGQEQEQAERVERIQVTGSRISRTDIESASPVQIIDRAAIDATGLVSIGDILQRIPSAGAGLNTAFNNGGNGATNLDLRNLGSQRLLVLVNGRRWISSLGSAVDMNSIPTAAIERVEVLKDGASAVYGSDAIAGVVNIITRTDFEGVEASVYGGENLSEGDGRQYTADLTFGTTTSNSGLLFNLSHVTQHEIRAGDRDISSVGSSTTNDRGRFRFSSDSITAETEAMLQGYGLTPNSGGVYDVEPDGNGGFQQYDGRVYNYAPDNYLVTPQERNSFYIQGHRDLNSNIRLVSDFILTNRKSAQELAPMPITMGAGFGATPSNIDIGQNEFNPFNEVFYGHPSRSGQEDYTPYLGQRRFVEAGPRRYEQDVNTYRAMIGLEGYLDNGWQWDAHYIYGQSRQITMTTGLLNMTRINQALSADCGPATNCVPLNLFGGEGTITQEMTDYVSFDSVNRGGSELKDYAFNISGELFQMPAGFVGAAFGVERREESGFDTPDPLTVTGETSGNQRDATSGGFRLDEAYAELSIPLHDTLLLTPAIRFSDHSAFGTNTSAKVGLEFRPTDELLVRGTWAEGYRAPSINDLFAGNADSYPTWTDPCNGGAAANPDLPGCAGVPAEYEQSNTQIRITQVASPDLAPETSESYTLGAVYNPMWLEGAEFTVDYFNITVEDRIGRIGHVRIASECAEDPSSELCAFIDRDAGGNVTDVRNFLRNAGDLEVEGLDFFAGYRFDTPSYGSFRTGVDATYIIGNTSDGIEQVGMQWGDTGYPRWKANLTVDWAMGDLSVHWATRYVHGMNNAYTAYYGYGNEGIVPSIGAYVIHDLSSRYAVTENLQVSLGVNNLFAKKPSPEYIDPNLNRPSNDLAISTNGFSVTEYDVNMDRFVYARATYRF